MKNTRDHDAFDSALENVLELAGYASCHVSTAPVCPASEIDALEAEAEAQARDLIDAGECLCCQHEAN